MSSSIADYLRSLSGTEAEEKKVFADDDEFVCYCRKCKEIVQYKWFRRKKVCASCDGKDLSLATKRALRNVYNIDKVSRPMEDDDSNHPDKK